MKNRFQAITDELHAFLASDGRKVAEEAKKRASESQGTSESSAPEGKSDPEVKDLLPGGGEGTLKPDATMNIGVESGTKPPGQPTPSTEEMERKETSPSSKVASHGEGTFQSLADSLKAKIADLGTSKTASAPDPEKDNAKTASAPEAGAEPEESSEVSDETVEEVSRKVAAFLFDVQVGCQVARSIFAGKGVSKTASAEMTVDAIEAEIGRKVAAMREQNIPEAEIRERIVKLANADAEAMMGGGAEEPAPDAGAPEDMGEEGTPDPQELIQALQMAIQSGEISEEEAIEIAQFLDERMGGGEGGGEAMPPEGDPMMGSDDVSQKVAFLKRAGLSDEGIDIAMANLGYERIDGSAEAGMDESRVEEIGSILSRKIASIRNTSRKIAELRELGISEENLAKFAGVSKTAADDEEKSGGGEEKESEGKKDEPSPKSAPEGGSGEGKASEASAPDPGPQAPSQDPQGGSAPSAEILVQALEILIQSGQLDPQAAASALEQASSGGMGVQKMAALVEYAAAVKRKLAEMAPPPAGGGAPPAAGGADPQAAIEQIIGGLEQLVASGALDEATAAAMLQQIGLAPPDGGGQAPPPPAAPAPPVA